jgi:hypothetical protein
MADSSINYINRLTTRYYNGTEGKDRPDFLTRDVGGQWRTNQPTISGYFHCMFGLRATRS